MGMTLTEKILAKHAGKEKVEPGELILAKDGLEIDVPFRDADASA